MAGTEAISVATPDENLRAGRGLAFEARTAFFLGIFALLSIFFSFPVEAKSYVRPYDLIDPRFCYLTPQPFLCQKCLGRDEQFVQVLSFESDGRPVRTYACRPWQRKYLN